MVRIGNAAAVYSGVKHGRARAQRSRATAAHPGIYAISTRDTRRAGDATSASENATSKESCQSEDSAPSGKQKVTDHCSSSVHCSCGALFSENARFCEACGAPHPSVARAQMRAKEPSRTQSSAVQRAALQAAQGQRSLGCASRSTDKVSQGCTGCSMM